jgi:chromosome segregation ATPase
MNNIEQLLQQILHSQNKTNERLNKLESQTSENTQILKALEHNSEVHKAELDNFTHTIAELSGDVKSIKAEVVKGTKAYDFLENFNKFSSME